MKGEHLLLLLIQANQNAFHRTIVHHLSMISCKLENLPSDAVSELYQQLMVEIEQASDAQLRNLIGIFRTSFDLKSPELSQTSIEEILKQLSHQTPPGLN